MKKGCLRIISFIATGILILILISRISVTRSNEKLERIAKTIYKYKKHDFRETDKWDKFILLPYLENEDKNGLIFTWIYILETGDTAKANIELSRKKRLLHDEEPLSIYFNYKHSYIFKTDKDLINLLPRKYKLDREYINKLSLSDRQADFIDSTNNMNFIIPSERLYDYLNKGFYSVLARYDNYTSISFYEPIANLSDKKQDRQTRTAKIIFNDSSDVLIQPYKATDEEWQNYNKE
jgi:hypothetical protein